MAVHFLWMGRFQCLAQGHFDKNSVLVVVSSFGGDATWQSAYRTVWHVATTSHEWSDLHFISPHRENKQRWMYWSDHFTEVLLHLQFILMSNCSVLLSAVSPGGFWTLMDSLSVCLHFLSLVLQSFNLCINPLWLHSPESYCITSVSSPLLSSALLSSCHCDTNNRGCCSVDRLLMLLTDAI